jgi:hypothetical protein
MPLPLLALAAAPAIAKAGLGLYQMTQKVRRQDTITPAEREQLAMARLAATAQLPGLGQYQGRLAQTQNAALQSAALGAGGASDFLGAASAADRVRQNGEQALMTQGVQYHQRAQGQLGSVLSAYGAHQRADTAQAAQANAQLKSAALNNINNALTEGASVATYGALQAGAGAGTGIGAAGYGAQINPALSSSPYGAGDYYGPNNPYRRRAGSMYGSMYGGFPTS